jgi:hypothetical protein
MHDRVIRPVLLVVAVAALAAGALPSAPAAVRSARTHALNGPLLNRCLATPAASVPASTVTVRMGAKTAWGFWLVAEAHGFSPGEPLLAWVFDPGWSTPSCLAAGNATVTGTARARVAFWSRASSAGRYAFCLVGISAGRTACGALLLTH